MGTKEAVVPSKSEKSSSRVQEQPSVHPYPDWASLQAYYGPGVPIPTPYFSATVAPGHTHRPYMWSPQPMLTPFGGPYTAIYPHGGVYSHSSVTHMVSPVNPEMPARPSNSIERGTDNKFNGLHLSTGNGNDENAGCNDGLVSESGDNDADSSEGSDGKSESRGNKKRRISSDDKPNSGGKKFERSANAANGTAKDAPPTISLRMTTTLSTVIGKPLCPVPLASVTPGKDQRSSNDSRMKHGGELILPTGGLDEREVKREKRKQSNRESARRSRLRKQAETEELAIKVGTLAAENNTLRSEIAQLTESSDKLRYKNSCLMEKLNMAQLRQEEVMPSDRIDDEDGPSFVIENLLSRIDKASPASGSKQTEDEPHDNASDKLHLHLDSNTRTDAVAAS